MNWTNFLILYLLQIVLTLPNLVATCQNLDAAVLSNYFSHHMLDVFIFWAPFFLQTRAEFLSHILISVSTLTLSLTWYNDDLDRCPLTVEMHRRCGYDETQWLDSLKNKLNLREKSEYFQFYWVGTLILYDLMNL